MKRVTLVKLLVNNLEEALEFYTKKLGFEVAEDNNMGDYRWLLVRLPDNKEFCINLDVAQTDEQKALVGCQADDLPLFSIETDNCMREYKALKQRGVEFEGEPEVRPYGTGVLMKDLYGNKIYIRLTRPSFPNRSAANPACVRNHQLTSCLNPHKNIMNTPLKFVLIAAAATLLVATVVSRSQNNKGKNASPATAQTELPGWLRRGIPGKGHAALEPLIGNWRQHKSIYGTIGRSPDLPPLIATDITTRRQWTANGHYIEDLTEGTIDGKPYWRKGWLGYSIMDRRYEWVTIDPINTTMMVYYSKTGSGETMPIDMTGVFTDQGVVNESTVGKAVAQHTVIRIENNDRHVIELYFTPPGGKEQLADRTVYTRVSDASQPRHTQNEKSPITLPTLPEPAAGETGPYCVIAKHRAKPGKADAYEKRMLADIPNTRAEPGALQFHIHRDRSDPNLFVVYEVWKDRDALRKHFEMPYVKKFVADSAEYVGGNMEVRWLIMASEYTSGK
jgi:quinol monooxygenase YgiN/catechol 2,3-dioxygenase-like lactoylglutathione lyase family enzyme